MMATAWHQIGRAHEEAGDTESAEAAYRHSLEIKSQNNDLQGQVSTLTHLGNLYKDTNRLEEALVFYKQQVDISIRLGDTRAEGLGRQGVALTWIKLKNLDEARTEINLSIARFEKIGLSAAPWKAFNILHDIETLAGNHASARAAWEQARDAYLAYRRQGGYASQGAGGQLLEQVIKDIQQGEQEKPIQFLAQASQAEDTPDWLKVFAPKILAILQGSRDKALGDDPALGYGDAAEVLFLIERLGG